MAHVLFSSPQVEGTFEEDDNGDGPRRTDAASNFTFVSRFCSEDRDFNADRSSSISILNTFVQQSSEFDLAASPKAGDILGLGAREDNGFIAADVDHSSLILCGKAFTDAKGTKEVLTVLSGPIICSRGGIPLSAGLLVSGDSVILLFAPEDAIQSCTDLLVSRDTGVIVFSDGVSPLFFSGNSGELNISKLPAAVIFASSDSSGTIPSASKLSPGQAAYHFLAGYQNGKFLTAYSKGPSAIDPLELAKAFQSWVEDNQISSFVINISEGEKQITGEDLIKLVQATLSQPVRPFEAKGGYLRRKYKSFLSNKFHELPEEFSF